MAQNLSLDPGLPPLGDLDRAVRLAGQAFAFDADGVSSDVIYRRDLARHPSSSLPRWAMLGLCVVLLLLV